MSTALSMARAGLGIAVLPEFATHDEGGSELRCLTINRPVLSRKIEIIQRKDRSLSPAAQRMAEILREQAGTAS